MGRYRGMMYGITGTPGTGKSSLTDLLATRGFAILHLSESFGPYILEHDTTRDTMVIDEERWEREFPGFEGVVEGHLAHLLPCDFIVILRCRPDVLSCRLRERGYSQAKISENTLAEAIDVVLIETLENFAPEQVYELDTTDKTIQECADLAEGFFRGTLPAVHGSIDWSLYIGMSE
jgi:adenylate kinase